MTRLASWRLALAASVSIAAACTIFNPLDDYGPPKPKGPDAGDSGTSGDGDSGCQSFRWPDLPTKDDGNGEAEYTFAIDTISIGSLGITPEGQAKTGFDLDEVCTCPGASSCVQPADAAVCDSDGGVDQAGTTLLDNFISSAGIGQSASKDVAGGESGFLFRLSKYNGQKNDTKVVFALFPSTGTEIDVGTGNATPPKHDGTDRWRLSRDTIAGGVGPPFIPLFFDTSAYVTNGVLVARADFPLPLGNLMIKMTGAYVVANVVPSGSSFRLENGRLVGRWSTSDLLTSLDALKDPTAGSDTVGLCGTSRLYAELKRQVCAAPDLAADPGNDGKGSPCNALGMLVLFTAEPAIFSSVAEPKNRPHLCGADYSDQCP